MIFSASPTISMPTVAVTTTAEPNPPQFRWVWQRLLVSFGGSSMVVLLIMIGFVLRVDKESLEIHAQRLNDKY